MSVAKTSSKFGKILALLIVSAFAFDEAIHIAALTTLGGRRELKGEPACTHPSLVHCTICMESDCSKEVLNYCTSG